jgi:hypothetical protein
LGLIGFADHRQGISIARTSCVLKDNLPRFRAERLGQKPSPVRIGTRRGAAMGTEAGYTIVNARTI